jgi:hypothetical protein
MGGDLNDYAHVHNRDDAEHQRSIPRAIAALQLVAPWI